MKVVGDFSRDEFIPIMFTLALVVGYSAFAQDLIDAMENADEHQSLREFARGLSLNAKLKEAIGSYIDEEIGGMPMENFKRNLGLISRFSFRTLLKQA